MLLWPAFRMQDRMQKHTLGNKAWNQIVKAKVRREFVAEYRKSHDGREPPKPFFVRMRHLICGKREPGESAPPKSRATNEPARRSRAGVSESRAAPRV